MALDGGQAGKPMTWDEVAAIIDNEMSQSDFTSLTASATERVAALDYYRRRRPVQPVEGRSTKLSPDVSTMVDHTLAQIMDAFSQPELVRVMSEGEADRQQAQIETNYLNWKFFQECDGWTVMYNAFKDALLFKNGISTVDVEDTVDSEYMQYEDLTQEQMSAFLDSGAIIENFEVLLDGEQLEDSEIESQIDQAQGEVRYNITVRVDYPRRKVRIREVAPEDFGVNRDHTSVYVQDARFVWERVYISASDLVDMGVSPEVVMELPSYSQGSIEQEKTARREYYVPTEPMQEWTRQIECYYCYIDLDMGRDGNPKPYRVLFSNRRVLDMEITDIRPYAVACAFPMPHTFYGESMYDKIKQIQDGKTELLRIAIDNAINLTYGRMGAVEGMVNMEDLFRPKPSGVVRMKRPDGLVPIPTAQLAQLPSELLMYYDKIRRESGGSALDMSSQNMPVNLETAHGAERMISSMEVFVALIAQAFANTYVRELYKLLHTVIRRYQPGNTQAMVNQQTITTDPATWPRRHQFGVNIGMSKGERQAQIQGLMAMQQAQLQLMQQGGQGVLVSFDKIYNTMFDMAKAIGLRRPGDYWVDPKSEEAQQAMQAKQKEREAQEQAQQAQQQAQAQFAQEQLGIFKFSEETKRRKVDNDYELGKLEQFTDAFHKQDKIANELTELELEHNEDIEGSRV